MCTDHKFDFPPSRLRKKCKSKEVSVSGCAVLVPAPLLHIQPFPASQVKAAVAAVPVHLLQTLHLPWVCQLSPWEMCLSELDSSREDTANLLHNMAPDHLHMRPLLGLEGASEMQERGARDVHHHPEDLPVAVNAKLNEILNSLNCLKQELSSLARSSRAGSSIEKEEEEGTPSPPQLSPQAPQPGELPPSPTPAVSFIQQRATCSKVRLNVGGKVVHVSWNLMLQFPDSRLGKIAQCRSSPELLNLCDSYDPDNNEIFFNYRHNNIMGILNYYRSNTLHISNDCCPIAFMADLMYWGLSETALEPCCYKRWMECKDQLEWEQPKEDVNQEEFPPGASLLQQRLWDTFEHPHTSTLARVIGSISVACIFISTIILTLETLPYFQEHEHKIHGEFAPFMIIEAIYMAYFSFEFLIRLISCPSKFDFLKNTMNWIDLLAIVPYFFTVALNSYGVTEEGVEADFVEVAGLEAGEPAGRIRRIRSL